MPSFARSGKFCRIRVQLRKCYKHLEIIGNLIWEQRLPNTYRWPQSIPTKHLDSHSQVRLLKGSKGHCFVLKLLISFCDSHGPVRQGGSVLKRTGLLTTRVWVKWSTFAAGWVLKLGHVWTLEAARSHELIKHVYKHCKQRFDITWWYMCWSWFTGISLFFARF